MGGEQWEKVMNLKKDNLNSSISNGESDSTGEAQSRGADTSLNRKADHRLSNRKEGDSEEAEVQGGGEILEK